MKERRLHLVTQTPTPPSHPPMLDVPVELRSAVYTIQARANEAARALGGFAATEAGMVGALKALEAAQAACEAALKALRRRGR